MSRVGEAIFERDSALIAERTSSYMELAIRTARMEVVLEDKMSHSKAVAVMFRKNVDDVFKDVTDVLNGMIGDER